MNKEQFSKALTDVNEKYIDEAAKAKNKTVRSLKIWRGIAIAACCVLATGLFLGGAAVFISVGASSSKKAEASQVYDGGYNGAYPAETFAVRTDDSYEYEAAYDMKSEAAPSPDADGAYEYAGGTEKPAAPSKIIFSAEFDLQTTEFDDVLSRFDSVIKKYDAYYETRTVNTGYNNYRNAWIVVRVPVNRFEELYSEIGSLATVISEYQSADDVSESYYEMDTRLSTARTKLARLQELLAQAEKIEDIITIESSISETEELIDYYQGIINHYDSNVDFSSIRVSLNEVYKVENNDSPITFRDRLGKAFNGGIENFTDGMENLVIFFASTWIWFTIIIVIIAAVTAAIILAVRRGRRK